MYYSEPNYAGYIVLGLIVSGAIAAVTAYVAKGKGRDPWAYGILGFFLPIIGLIIVLVQDDLSERLQGSIPMQRMISNGNMKQIPVLVNEWYLDLPFEILKSTISVSPNKDSAYLTLNMLNIGEKPIRSVYFRFKCYDDTGEELTKEDFFYAYQDMEINPDREFGKDISVQLPDFRTRNIDVIFEKMAFIDGTVLTKNEIHPKVSLLQGEPVSDPDLKSLAFLEHCGGKKEYRPEYFPIVKSYDKWLCMCGRTNMDTATCSKCGRTISQNKQIFSHESILCWKHEQEIIRNEKKLKEKEQTKNLIKVGVIAAAVIVMIVVIIAIYQHFNKYKDLAGSYGLEVPRTVAYILNDSNCDLVSDTDCIIERNGDITFMYYSLSKRQYIRVYGHLKPSDTTDYDYGIKMDENEYNMTRDGFKYRFYLDVPDPDSEYLKDQCTVWNDVGFSGTGSDDFKKDKHVIKTDAKANRVDAKANNSIGYDMDVEVVTHCEYCDKYATIEWSYHSDEGDGNYKYCYMCEKCENKTRQEILDKINASNKTS